MSDGTTGDWDKAVRVLLRAPAAIKTALDQAILREAHLLRAAMVKGIDSGAPGGQKFAGHSPLTLVVRRFRGFGGSKILVQSAALRNSITVAKVGSVVFVGVLRRSRGKGGRSGADIARIHEEGRTFTRTLSPKARRFLFAAMRAAGLPRRARAKGAKGGGVTITVRIPPRPFIAPVVAAMDRDAMQKRITDAIRKAIASIA